MGLREDIQSGIGEAFAGSLSDAVESLEFYRNEIREYSNGIVSEYQGEVIDFDGVVIHTLLTKEDRGYELAENTEFKIIALQNSLVVDSINTDDFVISENYGELRVVKASSDPARASWTMFLRRPT